jgi:TatD DNase family protein
MLFDAHLHLANEFNNTDFEQVKSLIDDAKSNNVERFITNSINLKTNYDGIKLAELFNEIYLAIGIYPLEIKTETDLSQIDEIMKLYYNLSNNISKKIMVGEIGLDFKESSESEKNNQQIGFIKQINFAKENNKFVQVHSRFAVKQTLELLLRERAERVIMHWYTTSEKYAKKAVDAGYYITVGPSYLYNHDLVYNNVKNIDIEKILFETDYPVSFNNIIQEPKVIKDIAEQLSMILK